MKNNLCQHDTKLNWKLKFDLKKVNEYKSIIWKKKNRPLASGYLLVQDAYSVAAFSASWFWVSVTQIRLIQWFYCQRD